jgi:hypothetical protein
MKSVFLPIATLLLGSASAQLVIDQATFFIGEGAVVTVQGNLQTNVAIQAGGSGATQGKIQMKGAAAQTITANGANAAIPFLEIDNVNNVVLAGTHDLAVNNRILFTAGKLQLANRNLIIPDNISFAGTLGEGNSKFVETNGTGELRQLVPANAAGKVLPVGTGSNYTPATYSVSGATFAAGSYIGIRASGTAVPTPQRHPRTESFLGTAWNVSRSGITGGTVSVQGNYTNGQITGTEADLRGMFWNGSTWSTAGGAQNAANNTVAANVPTTGGLVYGMNKFILASVKTFLQGAYLGGGLMRDQLRSNSGDYTPGGAPGAPLVPLSDPYRTAAYSTAFPHVSNATPETIASSVLNNTANAGDNIVDWVYVELRTNANPSTVLQTRAALIQRDGDIVDIDGVSQVYFKNVEDGNYNIAIRHRNHLGVRTATAPALSLSQPVTMVNLSGSAAANFNSFAATLGGGLFGMFGGNANSNNNTRITGADATASDFEFLKADLGGVAIKAGYLASDVNMNRNSRVSGADETVSDFEFIKFVLQGLALRNQPAF